LAKQDDSANPAIKHNSSLIIQIANDQTANDMQKKITAKQNKQYTTDAVLVSSNCIQESGTTNVKTKSCK
jgi:hypothetical protein